MTEAQHRWLLPEQRTAVALSRVYARIEAIKGDLDAGDLVRLRDYLDCLICEKPPASEPQPPPSSPTESTSGKIETECICPRVRSGEVTYQRCTSYSIGCRCHAPCLCDACCAEVERVSAT